MIFGKIAIKITVNKMHQKYLQIYFLALGPTKSINILQGLRLNLKRPIGGGNQGEWLGSFLPSPTLSLSACDLGTNSIVMVILPFSGDSLYPLLLRTFLKATLYFYNSPVL